jgi:hypothetical protein
MWKDIVESDWPHMTIWRMRIECCVRKATYKLAEYVLFIAFPLQQLLNKRASVLRYSALSVLFVFVNGVPQQTDEFANGVSVYSVN